MLVAPLPCTEPEADIECTFVGTRPPFLDRLRSFARMRTLPLLGTSPLSLNASSLTAFVRRVWIDLVLA